MTSWNYRLVDMTTPDTANDPWIEMREVFYNSAGEPCGHTRATMGGETMEELEATMDRFDRAFELPVLVEDDFIGRFDEEGLH